MKKGLLILSAILLITTHVHGDSVHWSYSGDNGPKYWGTLSPIYEMCSKGKNQSPIDISGITKAQLEPVNFDYKSSKLDVINNGHTLKANYDSGSKITIGRENYHLLQINWHTPSEHYINGKSFPMEAQLVHADNSGNLVVIGVLYQKGKKNKSIADIWDHIPSSVNGTNQNSKLSINALDMLPENRAYYRLNGSLTTPPCSEGVLWIVMKHSVTVSEQQVSKFHQTFHGNTNRPTQPLNSRIVIESMSSD